MSKRLASLLALMLVTACVGHSRSDEELKGEAENAVDTKLDAQATFTLMESILARKIACGHASAPDAPGRGRVDQDFVYLDGRLIMDDQPDYGKAAAECDLAAGGGETDAGGNASAG